MLTNKQWGLIDQDVQEPTRLAFDVMDDRAIKVSDRDSSRWLSQDYVSGLGQLVDLDRGQVVHDIAHPVCSTYFLFSGLISVTIPDGRSAPVEVLNLGAGDVTGLPYALSAINSPHLVTVRAAGRAIRVPSQELKMRRHCLQLFAPSLLKQLAFRAFTVLNL